MKIYEPKQMVSSSRYRNYFPTLPEELRQDVYSRINELLTEEREYCDKGNYAHMSQILISVALYEVLQKPGYIMAISPGTCVDTDEEWQRMLELDKKDIAIPAMYMKTAAEIMRHGDDSVPEYMIRLQKGDFTNCPKTTFFYGSDETLYACAPSFEAAIKKYKVDYEMIVGEGMFHCYPVFPVCKEGKEGWEMMIRLMKKTQRDLCR